MRGIWHRHKTLWKERQFLFAVAGGVLMLAAAVFATYYANLYTTAHASNAVTDVILDNIPVVNVDFVFSEGAAIFILVVTVIMLYRPGRIPFLLKSVGMFILVRSIFVTLTHIGPPIAHSYQDTTDLLYKLSSGDDLFFSAHTGLPFMLAYIFWDERILRYFFFACSAIGGAAVLLGHLHYSIDVFSALFIAFGIFYISKELFKRDYALLKQTAGE